MQPQQLGVLRKMSLSCFPWYAPGSSTSSADAVPDFGVIITFLDTDVGTFLIFMIRTIGRRKARQSADRATLVTERPVLRGVCFCNARAPTGRLTGHVTTPNMSAFGVLRCGAVRLALGAGRCTVHRATVHS